MNLFKNRKFKYGSSAVALTCVCIALVIIVNIVFSALARHYMWYADMTTEQLFDLSDDSIRLLDGYRRQDGLKIKIIFCMTPDELDGTYYYHLVHNLAQQYAREFDFIEVEYIDLITHPGLADPYKSTEVQTIKTTNVILTDGSRSKVFAMDAFYTFSENSQKVFAFNGEYKITAGILSLEGDNPIAYFTTGHGESAENSAMWELFAEAGFDVRTVDLSKEELSTNAKVVIINNPQYDLMGAADTVNEVKKIDRFLDSLGNLMIFLDATDKSSSFPEINELLLAWGLRFEDSVIYDHENSLSVDGTELVASYAPDGLGATLASSLTSLSSPPKTVVNYARPVTLLWEQSDLAARRTYSVLSTSADKTATAVPFGAGTEDNQGEKGVYTLMAISAEMRYINNVDVYNYVMVAGTSSFADSKYIGSSSYGNRDIIFSAMRAFGKTTVPIDLNFKVFDNEALDITTAEAARWTAVLTCVLPAVALVAGTVVYVRRRHL